MTTTNSQDLNAVINKVCKRVDEALVSLLPSTETHPAKLHDAMHYAVFNGGKRIRPLLVYAAGEALGVALQHLDHPAAAVECIHAYSLVHDDLPAMDDDDLRRGKPTCHIAYDEATAILVGDALGTQAFKILAENPNKTITADTKLKMIALLAQASGSRGMVGGQLIDLESEGQSLDIAQLEDLHIHKTGALIRASVLLGAMSSPDLPDETYAQLDHYAKCVGLAFQIQDDILDITGTTEVLGKTQGADIELNKATYPAILGLEESHTRAAELVDSALSAIASMDRRADPLRWLAEYIIARTH